MGQLQHTSGNFLPILAAGPSKVPSTTTNSGGLVLLKFIVVSSIQGTCVPDVDFDAEDINESVKNSNNS